MDVRLSAEQQTLRDSAAHAVSRLGPQAVGQLDDPERRARLEAVVVESGWRELRMAADDDGTPLASGVEAAIVAEELGRGLADAAYLGPVMAADLRRLSGAPYAEAMETVVLGPGLASVARVSVGSVPSGSIAVDADGSPTALVLDTDGRVGTVALDGLAPRTDLTRPTATPTASAAVLEGARPIGDEELARWNALALALTCADLVGVMRGAIDLAVEYANGRQQFGTSIGSFQAIQHLLAEAYSQMEGSRSAALHAAWAVDALPADDALAAAALAKAYCARSARTTCETVIQVHGGIGHTWECMAHVFLRRALVSSDLFGGVGPSLERVLAHNGIGGSDGLR
ncbi:MAG TPA: acyl-CoA dehydrogenase family protein [Acidimicrobiales bacterium]